jgi:hypothetical protein
MTRRYTHCVSVYMAAKTVKELAAEAKKRGISIAQIVREAVDARKGTV